ncbi:MAG: adenylate/guanylate cyclase domain-containing protein [Deltaproteobacteria bacterium]|nr:adenylate/guanylate cyclase domain-containing protein [Deltaproteobacteria bacterium]
MGTATRTVVFTDLANYTAKVAQSDREGLRRILKEHEALVSPIVGKYGGRVVKNLGDSFLILFSAATDSLRAALDVQHMVTEGGGISIRLAMTTGDVEEIDGDAFGEAVNLAARILSKTPAGEIWFGTGTYVCMNQAEIPWDSIGRFRLKGIPGEQEIFRAIPRHRAWLSEPVASAARVGNLVRLMRGSRPPLLPPDPLLLFEGFPPGSRALQQAVDSLPVLNPASLWLATYNISPQDRLAWSESGRGLVIGTPDAVEAALQETLRAVSRSSGSDTIVLDVGTQADLELVICGLALPAVPLSDVVSSYSYDLLPDGRWVNRSDRSNVRVEVTADGILFQALCPGVSVNGRGLSSGETVKLAGGETITTPTGALGYRATQDGYAGMLLADTDMRLGVAEGQTAELGREPNHPGLAYPDRRGQDNIRWCSGPRAARARAGGFTLDRALAGRRQAAIAVTGDAIQLSPLHARCPTYIMRSDENLLERAESPIGVQVDDMIVAGTTVVALRAPE